MRWRRLDRNRSDTALAHPTVEPYDVCDVNGGDAVGGPGAVGAQEKQRLKVFRVQPEDSRMKTVMNVRDDRGPRRPVRRLTASAIAFSAVALLVGSLLPSFPGFASPAVSPEQAASHKDAGTTLSPDRVQSAKVLFKKSKVYEIAFFSLTEGKERQVFEEYMPQAAPFFAKYGMKTIGMFSVVESRSDNLQSTMVGIFEWPDYVAKENLESDEDFQRIATLRDGAFSFFKGGWFSPQEDTEVTFYSDKVYELAGATLHPTEEAKAAIEKYFEVSEPIKRNYGGSYPEFLLEMHPADAKGTSTYSNAMQFIVQWDSVEDNRKLFADEDFKAQAAPLMQKAVARADFVFAKFIFSQG